MYLTEHLPNHQRRHHFTGRTPHILSTPKRLLNSLLIHFPLLDFLISVFLSYVPHYSPSARLVSFCLLSPSVIAYEIPYSIFSKNTVHWPPEFSVSSFQQTPCPLRMPQTTDISFQKRTTNSTNISIVYLVLALGSLYVLATNTFRCLKKASFA